jgi:hypothetical protein
LANTRRFIINLDIVVNVAKLTTLFGITGSKDGIALIVFQKVILFTGEFKVWLRMT